MSRKMKETRGQERRRKDYNDMGEFNINVLYVHVCVKERIKIYYFI